MRFLPLPPAPQTLVCHRSCATQAALSTTRLRGACCAVYSVAAYRPPQLAGCRCAMEAFAAIEEKWTRRAVRCRSSHKATQAVSKRGLELTNMLLFLVTHRFQSCSTRLSRLWCAYEATCDILNICRMGKAVSKLPSRSTLITFGWGFCCSVLHGCIAKDRPQHILRRTYTPALLLMCAFPLMLNMDRARIDMRLAACP